LLFVFLVSWPSRATAEPPSAAGPPVFIEVASPDGCGSSQELARRVTHRSDRVRIASSAEGAVMARAEIRNVGPGAVEATLTMTEPGGRRWSRLVRSATCEEALDAIALVLAVAFSPELNPAPEPEPVPPPPRPRPAEPRPKPPPEVRLTPVPTQAPPEPPPPEPPPPVEPVPAPRPAVADTPAEPKAVPAPESTVGSAGAAAGFMWGPAPDAMFGISIFGSLRWNRDSVISPAVHLRGSHHWMFGYAAPGGVANFSLDAGTLSLCPIWLQEHRVSVQPCATLEGGRLLVRGTETVQGATRSRPYFAAGASLAVDIEFVRGFAVTTFANGAFPFARDSFQFRPEVFYQVPVVVLTAGAGLAVRFL
jgi:hypothetical protein